MENDNKQTQEQDQSNDQVNPVCFFHNKFRMIAKEIIIITTDNKEKIILIK